MVRKLNFLALADSGMITFCIGKLFASLMQAYIKLSDGFPLWHVDHLHLQNQGIIWQYTLRKVYLKKTALSYLQVSSMVRHTLTCRWLSSFCRAMSWILFVFENKKCLFRINRGSIIPHALSQVRWANINNAMLTWGYKEGQCLRNFQIIALYQQIFRDHKTTPRSTNQNRRDGIFNNDASSFWLQWSSVKVQLCLVWKGKLSLITLIICHRLFSNILEVKSLTAHRLSGAVCVVITTYFVTVATMRLIGCPLSGLEAGKLRLCPSLPNPYFVIRQFRLRISFDLLNGQPFLLTAEQMNVLRNRGCKCLAPAPFWMAVAGALNPYKLDKILFTTVMKWATKIATSTCFYGVIRVDLGSQMLSCHRRLWSLHGRQPLKTRTSKSPKVTTKIAARSHLHLEQNHSTQTPASASRHSQQTGSVTI
jgi:hypothetical protein